MFASEFPSREFLVLQSFLFERRLSFKIKNGFTKERYAVQSLWVYRTTYALSFVIFLPFLCLPSFVYFFFLQVTDTCRILLMFSFYLITSNNIEKISYRLATKASNVPLRNRDYLLSLNIVKINVSILSLTFLLKWRLLFKWCRQIHINLSDNEIKFIYEWVDKIAICIYRI